MRDLYLLWPDLHNSTKQIKQIETNVRNVLDSAHAYLVPQGKTKEEINKVTAWGEVSLEKMSLSVGE